ncbi:MAG: efflux RND transporter periplasmic adaptor subunit [Dysgonamonadaceae bacterium]|nr:efflux RND transporter periplasmic adaptor subunit [Dysgonamonadaceae bacterium]
MKKYSYILVSLLLTACSNNMQQDAQTEIASPVSVRELEKGSISKLVNTSGSALPVYAADLVSEMEGKYNLLVNPLTGKPFRLGDRVQKGITVISLENKEYENTISFESKKLNLEIAEHERSKQDTLYQLGGVTILDKRNTEVKVLNARTEIENAGLSLEKMSIKAPFAGVITALPHYTPGVRVASGKEMLSVMDYARLYMDINMPESAINYVRPQQMAYITHYTLPNDTLKGVISELSPAISQETRTFKGRILIDNKDLKLRPGMFVKAEIVVDKADSAVIIPKDIILTRDKQRKYVFVVEKNTAIRRDITIGLEDDKNVEILKGLNAGEYLVVKGYETLKPDGKVKIQQ